jgi:lipopolysaccharide biosynthesis protein
LPQFHRIPENDAWWGEGFTEWTNVKAATPQFAGHYQPRVPGSLGYYDLLDTSVLRRQVSLARDYGIHGFCFYYYWFGGKRLLEVPIENYLQDYSLELSFCLCWANENWSRRWDGLDNDVLIGQAHSPEDDLAFIEDVARHLRDPRYIRIDGKPLLIVYRPDLLPSPKDTAARWRRWCLENGIGEVYLAYTQSFESVNPSKYGFDAAIEFPPNNAVPPRMTHLVRPIRSDFGSTVYDWDVFVKRSRQYKRPMYNLFRGVCPSWDNTARRKNRATVFVNNSPRSYQEWLFNAIADTRARFANPDERLIFINAWNEWAEGAYLEPDQRYGYAYLEATRLALVRSTLADSRTAPGTSEPLAIVVHVFFEEVLEEILQYTRQIESARFKLYVSCSLDAAERVGQRLDSSGHEYNILPLTNRGRDALPFLKVLTLVMKNGHDAVLKVHTKKSTHRMDGSAWRRELFDSLLTQSAIAEAMAFLREHPDCGVLGPAGHVLPLRQYMGSNETALRHLSSRLGIESAALKEIEFVAGSMFFARVAALVPLMNLAIYDEDFEEEGGQIDGTMAHAFERVYGISAMSAGYTIGSFGAQSGSQRIYPFSEKG